MAEDAILATRDRALHERESYKLEPEDETDEEIEAALAEMERCHCGGDAEIARLARELEEALERERRLREALLTLLTAVDRACGTAIPQGSFAAARQAARDAMAKATGANN